MRTCYIGNKLSRANRIIDNIAGLLFGGGICILLYAAVRGIIRKIRGILPTKEPKAPREPRKGDLSFFQVIVYTAVFGLMVWYWLGGGLEKQAHNGLQDIRQRVALDAEAQYAIAARSGSAMDRCIRAGLVAEGYIQAQNHENYQKWKAVEKRDCRAAGLRR